MHELGHNLGLRHGGGDGVNFKPSYLSIMNYAFQMSGLQRTGLPALYDYSRFPIALDERALDEARGFGVPAGSVVGGFETFGFCGPPDRIAQPARFPNARWRMSGASDFDCSGGPATTLAADLNADGVLTALTPFDDWANLVFDGGLVGLGASSLPDRTVMDEPSMAELLAARQGTQAPLAIPTPDPGVTSTPGATGTPGSPQGGSGLRAPPALSGLRVRPSAFRATRRARRGARVSYTLSEAGRIRFRVERVLPGRRRGGRCVAPRRAPRGRRCERREAVRGSFRRSAPAGTSSFRFGGRIGGKALKPGRHVLVATPLAADGRPAQPRRVRFRIVR